MHLSIVLPCYNEEENIALAVDDVDRWLKQRGIDGTIIVVDDGSTDGSAAVLHNLALSVSHLRVVTLTRNGGYGVAVRAGCDAAQTDWIGFMDSDGQFLAEDFDRLLIHIPAFPFVTGRRRKRADPLIRNIFGKVLGFFTFLTLSVWVRDVNCGMKVFSRDVWRQIRPEHGVEKLFNTEMFLNLRRLRIPWKQVDVRHFPRLHGTPTGGSLRVIMRMLQEMRDLRAAQRI